MQCCSEEDCDGEDEEEDEDEEEASSSAESCAASDSSRKRGSRDRSVSPVDAKKGASFLPEYISVEYIPCCK